MKLRNIQFLWGFPTIALLLLAMIPAINDVWRADDPVPEPFSLIIQADSLRTGSMSLDLDYSEEIPDPGRFFAPLSQDRPHLVWYWPGTDVDFLALVDELAWIRNQGFGGVEIHVTGKGISPPERKGSSEIHAGNLP